MKNVIQGSVIVTYRCNAKCHMCNIWQHPTQKEEELDPMVYEKLPDGLRINITGGEPMIRDDIEDIFKVLHPKATLLELSTNGYFTDRIVHVAEKYPDILIRISLEGLPQLNDSLRGIKNGFDHALRTILELKKTKCKNIGFSIVICDKNANDLVSLYELCSHLGVELGNSVMHNSWYFHKTDNAIQDQAKAIRHEEEFIKALLQSHRRGIKNKLKDYGRAWFNKSILKRFEKCSANYRPPCGAGKDFFFVDPFGNISPCNGSDEEWIIGNLKNDSFEDIMSSSQAEKIMQNIAACRKDCCFIVTERHDMVRHPWKPIRWILENKIRLYLNLPTKL
jgi:MoaA/NifB/PqqE/SkfB family radical SAM enzyme